MIHQIHYCSTTLYNHLGWREFTNKFMSLSEMLFETNSNSITESVPHLLEFLPQALCFDFVDVTPPPNEWECFIRSLDHISSIHLISIYSEYVSLLQFTSLLSHLTSCSFKFLNVELNKLSYSDISSYCDVMKHKLESTGIKIYLFIIAGSDPSTSLILPNLSGLGLLSDLIPQNIDQISSQDELYFSNKSNQHFETLFANLNPPTQINVLNVRDLSEEQTDLLKTVLPKLTNLQEIGFDADLSDGDPYSLLPYFSTLSNLKQLYLGVTKILQTNKSKESETGNTDHLKNLLNNNNQSLRGLDIRDIGCIGRFSLDELLIPLQYCTNLIQIEFVGLELQHVDVNLWCTLASKLKCLLCLELWSIPLQDAGVTYLSIGLLHHPTIRYLRLYYCNLTSESCNTLTHLIPTLKQLKTLRMDERELSEPDINPIEILEQTADEYSVYYHYY